MLEGYRGRSIEEIESNFRWSIPVRYNLGVDCSDRQPARKPALIHERLDGAIERYTFGDLAQLSNRFANALRSDGIARGDRVAIVLPQVPATVIAHLAAYKLGGVAVPMSTLFGPDALEMRLRDSGTKLIVTDQATLPRIEEIRRSPAEPSAVRLDQRHSRRASLSDGGADAGRWLVRVEGRSHEVRRPGTADLYERYDRRTKGCAAWAPRPLRSPAGL